MLNKEENCIKFWLKNIHTEYDYWNKGVKKDKQRFVTQSYSIVDYEKDLLNTKTEIRVLDVGCGPRGALRDKYDLPDNIKVYSCDPLAFMYMDILKKNDIKVEKEIEFCLAELLSVFYPENFFDYIIIQNALDHSINPQLAFEECLKLLKKDGVLYLLHEENEAEWCNYSGFHQWNFSLNPVGDFVISNKAVEVNINEKYSNIIDISSERVLYVHDRYWIKSKIKKVGDIISKIDNNTMKIYLTSFMSLIQEKLIYDLEKLNYQKTLKLSVIKKLKTMLLYFNSQR